MCIPHAHIHAHIYIYIYIIMFEETVSNGSIERENKFRQIKSSPYKLIYRGGTENKWYSFLLHQLLPPPPPRRPSSPPRPRWPTHITGKWGQRAGKESSVHGLSHRDLLEWGHADRNLFIGGYCNLALYIILPFLYFQIFVYIFIPLLLWEILSKRIPSFHAGSGNTFFRSFRGIRLWDNL